MSITSIRLRARIAVVGALAASMVVPVALAGPPASAAVTPAALYLVGPVEFDDVRNVSPDGRFAVVAAAGVERSISVPVADAPAALPGTGWVAHDDGTFAFRVGGPRTVERARVATGEVEEIVVPLAPQMSVRRFIDADGSGRKLLLEVRDPTVFGIPDFTYLYDTVSGSLTMPLPRLSAIDPGPDGRALSADGRFMTSVASVNTGANYFAQWFRLDLVTGAVVTRDEPLVTGGIFLPFPFEVSDDLEWSVFVSDEANVVPGLPADRRLYRRNFVTRATTVVPVDVDDVVGYDVADGGRVVVSHRVGTTADPAAVQLSVWEGGGALEMITVGIDGQPADRGVDPTDLEFVANADASRVTFTSAATNLAAGATSPVKRMYQAVLPSLIRPDAARQLQPDESVCAPVYGAAPGEFVGVNVTPVGATAAGYGVLHSSDERAGGTSNVNFASGTVDPNVAFAEVGVDGAVCFTNSRHGPVDVLLDAMVVGASSALRPISPTETSRRLLDTRAGRPLDPGERRCTATAGAAAGDFVGVNVTPVEATAAGFGTMHAADAEPLGASTVNFTVGSVDPNFAFVQVSAAGICFTNSVHATVDVIVDQLVVVDADAMRAPTPGPDGVRMVDTRVPPPARLGPSASVCARIPEAANQFAAVNITPVDAAGPGFGWLSRAGSGTTGTSNVNFRPGSVDPNLAMALTDEVGRVCFTNSSHTSVDVIMDAQAIGSADAFRTMTEDGPFGFGGASRILDTRVALP